MPWRPNFVRCSGDVSVQQCCNILILLRKILARRKHCSGIHAGFTLFTNFSLYADSGQTYGEEIVI
jgi:hypothetical protein